MGAIDGVVYRPRSWIQFKNCFGMSLKVHPDWLNRIMKLFWQMCGARAFDSSR